jgi:hypothetical protein
MHSVTALATARYNSFLEGVRGSCLQLRRVSVIAALFLP